MPEKGRRLSRSSLQELQSISRDHHALPHNLESYRNPQGNQNSWPSHTNVVRVGTEIMTTVIPGSTWRFYNGYWSHFNDAGSWFDDDPILIIESMNRDLTNNDYYADARFVAQVDYSGTTYALYAVDAVNAVTIAISREDNSQGIANVQLIRLAPTDAWTISGTSANALVTVVYCSATLPGIISTTTQSIAGEKTFIAGSLNVKGAPSMTLVGGGALIVGNEFVSTSAVQVEVKCHSDGGSIGSRLTLDSLEDGSSGKASQIDGSLYANGSFVAAFGMNYGDGTASSDPFFYITTYSPTTHRAIIVINGQNGIRSTAAGVVTDLQTEGGVVVGVTKTVGVSGSFTAGTKTITVTNGIITAIV